MATPAAPAAAPAPAVDNSIKVFVGNLSFKTKDQALETEFAASGKVVSAKVIRDFNGRSLGYGFVQMATLEDAKRSVDAMNKKTIDERQINVELAKPREEGAARPEGQPRARRGGRGGARGGRGGGRGGAQQGGQPQQGGAQQGGQQQGGQQRQQQPKAAAPAAPATPRTPSKTVLFISNLPFTTDDAALTKMFTDRKLSVKKAFVVKRQNGRSKGFGFAEFDTEDAQKKALEATNGAELDSRKLTVRIALTEVSGDNAPAQGGKQEQAAPAAAPAQQEAPKAAPAAAAAAAAPAQQQAAPAAKKASTPKKQ